MKTQSTPKIIICWALLAVICLGFTTYSALVFNQTSITMTMVLFSLLVIILFGIYAWLLKKHMLFILNQLSDLISSLIDGRENEVFSSLNDDMLSKLQTQVTKLSGILKAQNVRLLKDRDEIQSLIADISHQLKTPLANLHIYHDLLQDPDLTAAERRDFMQSMQGQMEKLSFLMESMIKMSRLESGIIQLKPQPASLNQTSLAAIKQVYQKAQSKNIPISFEAGRDIVIKHDPNWTAEAVFNLLDNAVKYTSPGGHIKVNLEKYELFARLDISDTGSGLAEAEINQVFKRFYRGENARHEEGVGIGLFLSRQIIEKQGGYIKVSSRIGEGSVFSVFLPID